MQSAPDVVRARSPRSLLADPDGVAEAWLGDAARSGTLTLVGIVVVCGAIAGAAMGA
jgi:hypothetical protein